MIFGADVVDYLLAVREAIFVSISTICGSKAANTNALTDLSEVATIESYAAAG